MARRRSRERQRFDVRGADFVGIAQEYRAALRKAERLWRRLHRRDVSRDPAREGRAIRELADVEGELDAARRALFDHTKKIATDPMRTRVKGLGLGGQNASTDG